MRYCVFAGSSWGARDEYAQAARELGQLLADGGIGLVYGGSSAGLMAEVADSALRHGGEVIGVIPQSMVDLEKAHRGLSDLRVTGSMHERKAMMAELADGFLALPGGLGTLDETFEIWTWGQIGLHVKPCVLVNVAHFYDGLAAFLDTLVVEGFVREQYRSQLLIEPDPAAALAAMRAYDPPAAQRKWIPRSFDAPAPPSS